jgi:PAS domain S-box-containing protein
MNKTTVLIVEDEAIVAADLSGKLGQFGYEVVGIAATGDEAIESACRLKPRIVLMDIWLKGTMDGIEAAAAIRSQYDVPVIYLTAHSDSATLERAKLSGPFGYILKPFEERELATTIEMALYKHQSDRQLRRAHEELEQRFEERTRELREANAYNRRLIEASLDPLVTIGHDGQIMDVNSATEAATGFSRAELIGTDFCDYFSDPESARSGYEKVFREGSVRDYALELRHLDGQLTPVLYNASVYRDKGGDVIGVFAAARDVTEHKKAQKALLELNDTLEEQVIERTAQLKSANETLRASRVAALNLMEDAVIARREAEEANEVLLREITERKRAEAELRQNREDLDRAQEVGQIGSWRLDVRSNVLSWSDENHRIFGVPRGTPLTYETFLGTLHPDDRHHVDSNWHSALAGEPYDIEHRIVVDGEVKWVREKAYLEFDDDGSLMGGFGITQDITARKRIEEELRTGSQRSSILAETTSRLLASDAPQMVVNDLCQKVMEVLDCQAFFNFLVDDKAGRLRLNACAGIPEDEIRKLEWLDYGVAEWGCAARDGVRIVAEDIPNTPDPRTDLVKSFGIRAYACHPLMVMGRLLGTLSFGTRNRPGFTSDELALMKTVADHVAIAMDRRQAEEELRHAREVAESASRAKSLFLANMSHELRTPMTGVLGMLEIARCGRLDEKQREAVDTAYSSGRSLLRILNDILDLTKVESGKLIIEDHPFSLRDCVNEAIEIIVPEARRKGLELFRSMAEDMPQTLTGDRVRLQQVLTNLVGNAVKFTEAGKVEVSVKPGNETPEGKREIVFTVRDTGIGIPDDKKDTIFQSFCQADDSHSRQYGGTGLGLAISREIVELMGGTISCESREGEGSTFTFTIPIAVAGAETTASPEPVKPAPVADAVHKDTPAGRKRLLIAEDDEVTRKVLGFMFQKSDLDFDFAINGVQVVEMWEKGDYDLVVMDGQMPGMDGFEATGIIRGREKERGGHIPIVAMTAHALKEDEERCLAAGMDAYVSKPIDFKRCIEVIKGLLNRG